MIRKCCPSVDAEYVVHSLSQQDERENPISTLPVPADPVTGLKSLPSWASQPYVRPLPAGTVFAASSDARGQGAMNDLATGGTGEERVAGLGKR
jgi:hypothetical protein